MNNNMLRAPLIKSALLLAGFSLLIYLTITSSDGSVWSSLQAIFIGIFRAAQLVVGLVLALFICIAVLIGIFFGAVSMVSRESAARMFNQLRDMIAARLQFVSTSLKSSRLGAMAGGHREELHELTGRIERQETEIVRLGKVVDRLRIAMEAMEEKIDRLGQHEQKP
jgi:hypothetical protein